jgi:hypothetical protein
MSLYETTFNFGFQVYTYTQALTPAKRQAQTKVVSMILPKQIQTAEAGGGD